MRLWLAWILLILGFVVLIPTSVGGDKFSLLGYDALCSWSPYSSIILWIGAVLNFWLYRRKKKAK
jgi:hypothetical protein